MYRITIQSQTQEFDTLNDMVNWLKDNYQDPLSYPFSVDKMIDGEWQSNPDPFVSLLL